MNRKFTKLYESSLNRYTSGSVLVGDVVTLKPGAMNHEGIKGNDVLKQKLNELLASDLNLRVINIKNQVPVPFSGNNELNISGRGAEAVIAQEIAPSRYHNYVAVPLEVLEVHASYPNLPPIPDSWKYKAKINMKPQLVGKMEQNEEITLTTAPVKSVEQDPKYVADRTQTFKGKEFNTMPQTHRSDVHGKLVTGDRELKNANVKIPAVPAEGAADPATYTAKYMPKKG